MDKEHLPKLHIKGDVNGDTGDIKFNGTVIVDGIVKAGCNIKCASLSTKSVQGAKIYLTGDLHVSHGIIDSHTITVRGNVYAEYINNSKIKALGNIVVQKEIIDSELFIGGQCINKNGIITSSLVNARSGIVAGQVGTQKASPSKFEVGTEGIIEMMLFELDVRIKKKSDEIRAIKKDIANFESEEKILHIKISDALYVQDHAQIDLRKIEKQLPTIEASEDIMQVQQMVKVVKELKDKAEIAEKTINEAFKRQAPIAEQILIKQRRVEAIANEINAIELKKRGVKELAIRNEPKAEVNVNSKIMSGTSLVGKKAKLVLTQNLSRCRIYETNNDKMFDSKKEDTNNIDLIFNIVLLS
ncbi:MAG: DUF342 domain-containing protein [Desulfamplus sp.]|nr:DUF342 domain-containing protein [Desulfamplus sp.]